VLGAASLIWGPPKTLSFIGTERMDSEGNEKITWFRQAGSRSLDLVIEILHRDHYVISFVEGRKDRC
jgi:hypothetical protein